MRFFLGAGAQKSRYSKLCRYHCGTCMNVCENENITTVDACEIILIIIQLGIERFKGKMIKAHSSFSSGL